MGVFGLRYCFRQVSRLLGSFTCINRIKYFDSNFRSILLLLKTGPRRRHSGVQSVNKETCTFQEWTFILSGFRFTKKPFVRHKVTVIHFTNTHDVPVWRFVKSSIFNNITRDLLLIVEYVNYSVFKNLTYISLSQKCQQEFKNTIKELYSFIIMVTSPIHLYYYWYFYLVFTTQPTQSRP